VDRVAGVDPSEHVILFTNSQLSSVALASVRELSLSRGIQLEVFDGPKVKDLLASHPDIVAAYFPARKAGRA
jgi:hypothetical protein